MDDRCHLCETFANKTGNGQLAWGTGKWEQKLTCVLAVTVQSYTSYHPTYDTSYFFLCKKPYFSQTIKNDNIETPLMQLCGNDHSYLDLIYLFSLYILFSQLRSRDAFKGI